MEWVPVMFRSWTSSTNAVSALSLKRPTPSFKTILGLFVSLNQSNQFVNYSISSPGTFPGKNLFFQNSGTSNQRDQGLNLSLLFKMTNVCVLSSTKRHCLMIQLTIIQSVTSMVKVWSKFKTLKLLGYVSEILTSQFKLHFIIQIITKVPG